jgi:hypothetical protein
VAGAKCHSFPQQDEEASYLLLLHTLMHAAMMTAMGAVMAALTKH